MPVSTNRVLACGRRPGLPRAVAVPLVLIALAAAAWTMSAGEAQGQCQGNQCLPDAGDGYTFDVQYDCGLIYSNQFCFEPGNCLGYSCAHVHTFGFGSSLYKSSSSVPVVIVAPCYNCSGDGDWGHIDSGLARACRYSDCHDSTNRSYYMFVGHNAGGQIRHTITGHGKA